MCDAKEIVMEELQNKNIIVDDIICKEETENLIYFDLFKGDKVFNIEVEKDTYRLPVVFVDEETREFHPLTKNFVEYIGGK